MNKFKKILLGTLSVLTLGLFVVTGAKVNAATNNYNFDYSAITIGDGTTTKPADKAALSQVMLGDANSFLHIKNGDEPNSKVTYRTSNGVIELVEDNLSVDFTGTGSISFGVASTGGSNVSNFGLKSGSSYLTATTVGDGLTLLSDPGDYGNYQFTGTTVRNLTYTITNPGTYTLVSYYSTSSAARGCRIKTVSMTDESLKSNTEKIAEAIEAIEAIGAVTYSNACYSKIQTAEIKISMCDNGIDDIESYDSTNSTNYVSTYNTAVSNFASAESSAISTFTSAVSAIGTVGASSGSAITAAETAYNVLFGNTLTKPLVVSAKNTLTRARNTYENIMIDLYAQSVNISSLDTASAGSFSTLQLGHSVFTALDGGAGKMKIDGSKTSFGSDSYTQRIITGGASTCTSTVQQKVIKFSTSNSGKLKIAAISQSSSDNRTISFYNSAFSKLDKDITACPNKKDKDGNTLTTNPYQYIEFDEAGTYYIATSDGIAFYYLEFISDATIYWQQGENEASDLIRVIGVIGNVEYENGDISNIDKVTFSYTKSGSETLTTKTVTNVYSQINNGSSAYEVGYVSFAAHDNKLYAVYQFGGYEAFHAAGKSMDISINVYFTGSETPVTATKTIA